MYLSFRNVSLGARKPRSWFGPNGHSPLRVKEDDEVDNLDVKLVKRKSKRVYQSPPPEVGLKISRSLKSLNAKTGLFSKRMKIIHRDPMLHAQRVAAIKKAKGTAAARKHTSEALKAFFRDPENRRKRSSMTVAEERERHSISL
ncbi:hypothetical protein DVH24_040741 [Malus domestica]|uniref:Uncharacterized protein n=1 Tax=Malus domestica TaxID=3750 RepID=A0A498IC05_MALDO|nr:hypothetical protein DVH24_040741 [Malus domestica]